jgi:hypothetical protein
MESDKDIDFTTDMKLIFPLKGLDIDPTPKDVFQDDNGKYWDVVKPIGVPGDSAMIVHVRKR